MTKKTSLGGGVGRGPRPCPPCAFAKAPPPLVPTALVEDVKSTTADVEFMDYVGTGQVIELEADATCWC